MLPLDSNVEFVDGEWLLDCLPLAIYMKFDGATWQIGKLEKGVYPVRPAQRVWKVHKGADVTVKRNGFFVIPDFSAMAHNIQGTTLDAAYCDEMEDQVAAYIGYSHVKTLDTIYLLAPVSPRTFQKGLPTGPDILILKLEERITPYEAFRE